MVLIMKCYHCDKELIEYPHSQGQSMWCKSCDIICATKLLRDLEKSRNKPMSASELEERYRIIGGQIQEAMIKVIEPFIWELIKIIEKQHENRTEIQR